MLVRPLEEQTRAYRAWNCIETGVIRPVSGRFNCDQRPQLKVPGWQSVPGETIRLASRTMASSMPGSCRPGFRIYPGRSRFARERNLEPPRQFVRWSDRLPLISRFFETWVRDRRLNHVDCNLAVGELRLADIHTSLDAVRNVRDLNPMRASATAVLQ
jgi:hypothetical protein